MKHEGYNDVVTSTNTALDWKYNGIELEEAFDINLYEMPLRQYDPAIARFTSIDSVIHWDFSTYNSFDNNPIVFADPSGADAEDGREDRGTYNGGHWSDGIRGIESGECPSCKTQEDWQNYFSQAENTAAMVGDESAYDSFGRVTSGQDEDGNTLIYLDGELQDLRQYDNYLDALSHFFSDAILPESPGKVFKFLDRFLKGTKTSSGVNVSKGAVKFSDEAKDAIFELGTYHYFTDIKDGVGRIDINFTKTIPDGAIDLVENTFKANGATSMKIITNTVTPRFRRILNYKAKNGSLFNGYKVKKRWNPWYPFELTKVFE